MCIRDRLVNIRHQDAMTKALDMVPDLVNRFVGGKDISPEAIDVYKRQFPCSPGARRSLPWSRCRRMRSTCGPCFRRS